MRLPLDHRSSCLPRAVRIDLQTRQNQANAIESDNLDGAFPVSSHAISVHRPTISTWPGVGLLVLERNVEIEGGSAKSHRRRMFSILT